MKITKLNFRNLSGLKQKFIENFPAGKAVNNWLQFWEKKIFYWLDTQPSIKQWGSESVVVSYKTPFDNLLHKYYIDVDFWAKEANSEKEYTHFIVEIKPFCQTIPPVKGPRTRESTYRKACETYITNVCKWNAALEYENKEKGYF